jgi:protocatechuate 3,4-dioxygenase beta subunit
MAPASHAESDDVLDIIDEEVARLPSRYRDAVVLCDLEGLSYTEAARRLRCPLGTLQSRLARGRSRLRTRLVSRGVAPLAISAFLADAARAAVPEALAETTIRAATAGPISATAAALAGTVARNLVVSTTKNIAGVLCLASITMGAGLLAHDRLGAGPMDPAPAAAAVVEPPQPEQPKTDRTLKLEVVSGDENSALPGASVWTRANWSSLHDSQGTTDEEGRYTVALPAGTTTSLQLIVVHPGFAPIELRWARAEPIPESYTVSLEPGVPIGGTVRDEQGRPIAGARVLLQIGAAPPGGRERYANSEIAAAVTDDRGQWRSETLPASAGPGVRLDLVTTHPDHVVLKQAVTAEALRAFTAAGVMKSGQSLSGTVLSPTGRPVAGAMVIVQSRPDRSALSRIQTDREGRFRTGPIVDPNWREFTIVVRADGFASFAQTLLVPPEIEPQTIRLSPRKPLHGRVVDARGRPVAGAVVISATELSFAGLDWEAETNVDGQFVWYDAPVTGTYILNVQKPPFRHLFAQMIPGGSEDFTITLHRLQRVHGTVTDAETGRSIERFVLIRGSGPHRPGWPPDWYRDSARSFSGSQFELTGDDIEQNAYHSIRIEADGYEPAEFLRFHDSLEDVEHNFKLRKATLFTGTIHGSDGRPLAGVDVTLSGSGYDASVENGRLNPRPGRNAAPRIRTGPDGRYAFQPQGRRASVIAIHDAGFAVGSADDPAAASDLALAPWGRVEGLVQIGDEPASAERVAGWLRTSSGSASLHYETHTLASGRFVLDRVAPGRLTVYRRVENQDRQGWTASHSVSVNVKPGETVRLQLGGTGRPVVGRLAIPDGVKLSHFALGSGALAPVLPEPPTPGDFLGFDSEQRSAWWDAFARTPEGRAHVEDRDRSYAVALRPDGTFRIEDVPAGRYLLKLPFEGLSRGTREGRQAFARSEVVVPEIPGGRSDEPLDIGAIPLEVFPFHEPNVGDRAPTIAAKAPDGRPLDLAVLRGRFVLLHLWSGRPEDAEVVPHLKATYDLFGRDARFVMLGLIADETPGPVRRYAARHGLSWEQRFIGSTYDPNPFEAAFGIWFPPAAFLIGPDGRILAKDLQGEAIKQAVTRALKPQPQSPP